MDCHARSGNRSKSLHRIAPPTVRSPDRRSPPQPTRAPRHKPVRLSEWRATDCSRELGCPRGDGHAWGRGSKTASTD